MSKPKWLIKKENPTTRSRSKKQETRIAKVLSGKTTINSGATFGQNDVINDFCEVEAKTTGKNSFSLKVDDWQKMIKKCSTKKIPIFQVQMENAGLELAVIDVKDLNLLLQLANG
jgi:hypothetical protein